MDATLETALTKLAELEEYGKKSTWAVADLVKLVVERYGPKVAGQIADILSCSKRHVKLLAKVSETFQSEEIRYPDVPWGAYLLITDTDDPNGWLALFVDNRWSLKDLKTALKAGEERKTPAEQAVALVNRLAGKLAELEGTEDVSKVLLEVRAKLSPYIQSGA